MLAAGSHCAHSHAEHEAMMGGHHDEVNAVHVVRFCSGVCGPDVSDVATRRSGGSDRGPTGREEK
eukprot:2108029-Rhodomonas_salina.1